MCGIISNMDGPQPKRMRVEQKTADQVLAEQSERAKSRRLPPVGANSGFKNFLAWMKENCTRYSLADDAEQLIHWSSQTRHPSKRTFRCVDGLPTATYTNLQSGHVRATASSAEDKQLARTTRVQNMITTRIGRDLGQLNWLESAGFVSGAQLLKSGGSMVQFERMLDSGTVDFYAMLSTVSGLISAPVQVKVARGPPGTKVNFHLDKEDGVSGGRYEDHILICLVISAEDDLNCNCVEFDELPDVDLMEAYIMRSSDIKSNFQPVVYDHKSGSKRGRENAYEAFRYVVDRDSLKKLRTLIRSLESNIQEIWDKRHWTRDDCFFKFGEGSPNTNIGKTKQTELLGAKAVSEALAPFEARAPLRQNETIDILFWDSFILDTDLSASSVRISLKTASYNNINKNTGGYSGFYFLLNTAPNCHHCDIVVALQFNLSNKTQVVAAYVFDSTDVYNTGLKTFNWHKSAHTDKAFDMTNDTGRQAFKERVASFMKSTEERRRVQKVLQRFRTLYERIRAL